jgi:predicted SnoaL-like aldol condensation-catalyzing enzyme
MVLATAGLFKKFVSGLPKDTKVNTVRIFADGDYVVAHSEITLSSPQIVFDIFRFENGLIVEHWDNREAKCPRPNGSGRTQIDGPTEITDRDKTEANKALANEYFEVVVIGGKRDQALKYRDQFHQHNCYGEDNKSGAQTQQGHSPSQALSTMWTKCIGSSARAVLCSS